MTWFISCWRQSSSWLMMSGSWRRGWIIYSKIPVKDNKIATIQQDSERICPYNRWPAWFSFYLIPYLPYKPCGTSFYSNITTCQKQQHQFGSVQLIQTDPLFLWYTTQFCYLPVLSMTLQNQSDSVVFLQNRKYWKDKILYLQVMTRLRLWKQEQR